MKKIFMMIALIFAFATPVLLPRVAYADTECNGVTVKGECPEELQTGGDEDRLIEIAQNILSVLYIIIALIAVVVIVVAGVMYMLAAGDPGKLATAKKAIMYAIMGLVVAVLAYAITNFVIAALQ